jgi:transcriptional regulator with PAS, ATPase and Fis domain
LGSSPSSSRKIVPPLRDRLEDLQLLAGSFLAMSHPPRRLSEVPQHIWDMFRAYRWPGNVRELRNAVQRVLVMPERVLEGAVALPPEVTVLGEADAVVPLRVARRDAADAFERAYLQALLAKSDGNITRAAALAEVSRQMIHKLVAKHGL